MEHLRSRLRAIPDLWGWAERIPIVGLFCLALGYTAYVTQIVLVPIVFNPGVDLS